MITLGVVLLQYTMVKLVLLYTSYQKYVADIVNCLMCEAFWNGILTQHFKFLVAVDIRACSIAVYVSNIQELPYFNTIATLWQYL